MADEPVKMSLVEAQAATKLPPDPNAGQRTTSSADMLYVEPLTADSIRDTLVTLGIEAGLIAGIYDRLSVLEKAVRPFAMKSVLMANAQMCLQADGRGSEPSGGTWINALTHSSVTADEQIFFNACDAYGRKRTEEAMLAAFLKVQKAANAQAEKDAHVEDLGTVH